MSNRITLIIYSLSAGGAERVASVMANYWAVNGYEITLLTLNDKSEKPFYELDPRVKYHPLGIASVSRNLLEGVINNLKRILSLRRAIRKSNPDAVISLMSATNVLTILAGLGLKIPIIVSEHVDPHMVHLSSAWGRLRKYVYPMADRVVLLNEGMKAYFGENISRKTIIIPNPVTLPPKVDTDDASALLERPSIVAMGRFSPEKGFDMLLRAFATIKDKHPAWSITILGDGGLRGELETLRSELNLDEKVHMPGMVQNPHDYLNQADIFVLSSRNEAFPMALCEAMACALPVISFDCNSGPSEIIRDGVDGILVPPDDVAALAGAMDILMGDTSARKRLAEEAPKIIERFAIEKVMGMWIDLIKKLTKTD